ncbi:hypothetical protein FA13DRAFT_1707059 [Coprinellus micaceus]|uniref:Uncharacterized protein n=1 Tax=Coprinellus micaceus TaxID=71717 RepID=A0A4Y7TLK2_COPMI|nr:hypothetical protein FA13DRAFT_1707059 [Coprinellus micaceus]
MTFQPTRLRLNNFCFAEERPKLTKVRAAGTNLGPIRKLRLARRTPTPTAKNHQIPDQIGVRRSLGVCLDTISLPNSRPSESHQPGGMPKWQFCPELERGVILDQKGGPFPCEKGHHSVWPHPRPLKGILRHKCYLLHFARQNRILNCATELTVGTAVGPTAVASTEHHISGLLFILGVPSWASTTLEGWRLLLEYIKTKTPPSENGTQANGIVGSSRAQTRRGNGGRGRSSFPLPLPLDLGLIPRAIQPSAKVVKTPKVLPPTDLVFHIYPYTRYEGIPRSLADLSIDWVLGHPRWQFTLDCYMRKITPWNRGYTHFAILNSILYVLATTTCLLGQEWRLPDISCPPHERRSATYHPHLKVELSITILVLSMAQTLVVGSCRPAPRSALTGPRLPDLALLQNVGPAETAGGLFLVHWHQAPQVLKYPFDVFICGFVALSVVVGVVNGARILYSWAKVKAMPISDFSTPRYTWLGAFTDTGLSSIIGLVLALPMGFTASLIVLQEVRSRQAEDVDVIRSRLEGIWIVDPDVPLQNEYGFPFPSQGAVYQRHLVRPLQSKEFGEENNSPVSPYRESQGAVIDAYVQIDPLQGGREDFDPWYDADGCRMGVCTLACSLHLPASIKSFPVAWNIIICEAWFISLRSASVSATIPVKAGPDNPLSLDFWGLWPYEL